MRYAKDAVLVVSRIDLATGKEVVVGFNNGTTPATVDASADRRRRRAEGLTLTIPPVSALVAFPSARSRRRAPPKPALTGGATI